MTSLVEDIKNTADEIKAAKERLREQSRTLLEEGYKKIFEEYPTVGKIRWTQYTPYFNDGDECVFGVHEPEIIEAGGQGALAEEEDYDGYAHGDNSSDNFSPYSDSKKVFKYLYRNPGSDYWSHYNREGYDKKENPEYDPAYGEPYEAIRHIYETVDQESMKEIFGDHVEVTVTRDGIEVTEYHHD